MALENLSAKQRNVVAAISKNAHRLLADARLLRDSERYPTAMSLAILALEEAGKAHALELEVRRPRAIRSQHVFRHIVGMFVLMASLDQKHELNMGEIYRNIPSEERVSLEDARKHGAPEWFRQKVRDAFLRRYQQLDEEQKKAHFIREIGLVLKVSKDILDGNLEMVRQKGLYLDAVNGEVTSSPETVRRSEAELWIWVAERVLHLLDTGEFSQDYAP